MPDNTPSDVVEDTNNSAAGNSFNQDGSVSAFTPPRRPLKQRLPLKIIAVFLFVALVLVVTVLVRIGSKIDEVRTSDVNFKKNTDPVQVVNGTDQDWKNYRNEELKFTFDYPASAKFELPEEEGDSPYTFRVIFTGESQKEEVTDEPSLYDGYIFKVVVTTGIPTTETESLAEGKRASYEAVCPGIYSASKVEPTEVNTIEASYFTVTNCPGDYTDIFVHFNSSVFEIVSVYRGDVGYKQQYLSTTKRILESFRFIDKPIVKVEDPLIVRYNNSGYMFSFDHPRYDTKCCDVSGPSTGNFQKLDVFAQVGSQVDSNRRRFNGFGIYAMKAVIGDDFGSIISSQKSTLENEYKVIKGVASPSKSEETIDVGSHEGVLLKGYAWWGDIIFVPVYNVDESLKFIFAISKSEVEPGVYDKEFRDVLSTFRFNVAPAGR
jgi:hypothetical protein